MLHLAYDPVFAHPLPEGHRFPMLKYELIPAQLLYEGLIGKENIFSPTAVPDEIILMTHTPAYLHQLDSLSLPVPAQRRIGFPLTAALIARERRIAQGTIDGCRFAMNDGVAFNVAGGTHHAGSSWGEGFCLLNDQAIAARELLKKGLAEKILIVDLDVHQGNGTAEIFAQDERVFTFSMHGANNFPFRKERSDLDIPLDDGVADAEYLAILSETLPALLETVKPGFVFYLAGADVLASDRFGKLALTREGAKQRDRLVFEECRRRDIPVQVSMGGGYSPAIRDIVDVHCNTFRMALDVFF